MDLVLVPTIRDMRPYPESPEARALGCCCEVARLRGMPIFTRDGAQIFAIIRNCPVHDNRKGSVRVAELADPSEKSHRIVLRIIGLTKAGQGKARMRGRRARRL